MKRSAFRFTRVALAAALTAAMSSARADAVTDWNVKSGEVIAEAKMGTPPAVRVMALVQTAAYEAARGAGREASVEAAIAAAHRVVLAKLIPSQQAMVDNAYNAAIAPIAEGAAKAAGVAIGEKAAAAVLASRADDVVASESYRPYTTAGMYVPTSAAAVPQWGSRKPWNMSHAAQFRPGPPPALDSAKWASDYNEVRVLGAKASTARTAEQTDIARFWAGPSGTVQPPGHWNSIARGVADAQGNSLAQNARMMALLNIGMADALITAWDTKYAYSFVRPVTAIRNADNDGNPDTAADPAWSPLLTTPGHPSYMAAHSAVSATAATVLAEFYGNDSIAFTSSAEVAAGGQVITRTFNSFSQAAQEAGASRIYGGIHWSFDNEAGLEAGHSIGEFVSDNLLGPRGNSGNAGDHPGGVAAPQRAFSSALPSRSNADRFFSDAADDDLLD